MRAAVWIPALAAAVVTMPVLNIAAAQRAANAPADVLGTHSVTHS
ncbi:MAG TPA: hypothetical protein VFN75_00255 [Pseudonocardiaceae bacterium]|nr:hypothetical protein [Pseudonocardiaceae bacterium]